MYQLGDPVVFVAPKHSVHPGPRAEMVQPEAHGEGYTYFVKKYWVVLSVRSEGVLEVVTRRGKRRLLRPDDPRLRPARWWERMFLNRRFPRLSAGEGASFEGR